MVKIGLDVGSAATKCALWDGSRFVYYITPTGWSPAESAECAVRAVCRSARITSRRDISITATGYGRNIVEADRRVTEITCHAAGARLLAPGAAAVLDIGGQDTKAIKTDEKGKVLDFLMNDKCAAGTGRFLQNMATRLGCKLSDFCDIPEDTPLQPVNSMCAVFAESEVIGLLSKGADKNSICLGLLDSVAQRAANLLAKVSESGDICFTGGCAQIGPLARLIGQKTGRRVIAPDKAQFAGAIGAASLE